MSQLIDQIKSLSEANFDRVLQIRRHLHAHPELSFEEHQTAAFIEDELSKMGFETSKRIFKTGVTLDLLSDPNGPTVALRADIDALPIDEANETSYKSQHSGVMHACGHDVHTASLLGACMILKALTDQLKGNIRIIFQPGEEKAPGGASKLIEKGILTNPRPVAIIGQHVMPLLEVGKVGFRSGKYMASADELYLTVKGKGGHAAMPENLIDPILMASHIIVGLQQIVSRRASPKIPTVLSFGDIRGIGATNVIPNEVKIAGTFRTFDEKWREDALTLIQQTAQAIAVAFGGTCEVNIVRGYPYLVNDISLTDYCSHAAAQYIGSEQVTMLDMWMASEDFAFYTHEIPGCFYRLGTRNESKGIIHGVHTNRFDIDEDALKTGMGMMAYLAVETLKFYQSKV